MSNEYNLVNPRIEGSLSTSVKSDNSFKAARKLYEALSEHFNNSVSTFHFTIQKGSSGKGKFYHFRVNESRKGDEVDYTLESVKIKNEEDKMKQFKGMASQSGGAKKKKARKIRKSRPSKDSESDDSDLYEYDPEEALAYGRSNITYSPITYFWYYPYIYDIELVTIPTFNASIVPIVEIPLVLI